MSAIPVSVIDYFAAHHDMRYDDAAILFDELENFLAASSAARQVPTRLLDEAWHAFILHTREYAEYCSGRFGKLIHHIPENPKTLDVGVRCKSCSSNCSGDR